MGCEGEVFFRIFQLSCFPNIKCAYGRLPSCIPPKPGKFLENFYLLGFNITPNHTVFKCKKARNLLLCKGFLSFCNNIGGGKYRHGIIRSFRGGRGGGGGF